MNLRSSSHAERKNINIGIAFNLLFNPYLKAFIAIQNTEEAAFRVTINNGRILQIAKGAY